MGNNIDKSQNQFLSQHTLNGVIVLTFTEPSLDADAVEEAISVINAVDKRKVILDLQSVRFLVGGSLRPNQEPLTPILKLSKQLNEKGGRLVLCNVATEIAEVLPITRLNRIIEIQPDVAFAVACMDKQVSMNFSQ